MAAQVLLVFKFPNHAGKYYWRRELAEIAEGRRLKRPEFTENQLEAHRFHPPSAISFRDYYRDQYGKGASVFIESTQSEILFEREAPPPPNNAHRLDEWIIPEGFESSGLGFRVKPAATASLGRCWAIRASDVPSLDGRVIETIYAASPEDCVVRAMVLWQPFVKPYEHPLKDQQETAAVTRTLQQIEEIKRSRRGRSRPGDITR